MGKEVETSQDWSVKSTANQQLYELEKKTWFCASFKPLIVRQKEPTQSGISLQTVWTL